MRGEIALVARIVRHGDAVLGSVWSKVSRSVRAMSQSCWQGRPVRETAARWGPLRRVGRGTVMLSWGVNIFVSWSPLWVWGAARLHPPDENRHLPGAGGSHM